mmetsp:Transcript_25510/g.34089  ORF Transcript_25510/g.34089 Transcript_25510/m.34089 type:complete len:309 (+) Transcript_25510:276-1202(+)
MRVMLGGSWGGLRGSCGCLGTRLGISFSSDLLSCCLLGGSLSRCLGSSGGLRGLNLLSSFVSLRSSRLRSSRLLLAGQVVYISLGILESCLSGSKLGLGLVLLVRSVSGQSLVLGTLLSIGSSAGFLIGHLSGTDSCIHRHLLRGFDSGLSLCSLALLFNLHVSSESGSLTRLELAHTNLDGLVDLLLELLLFLLLLGLGFLHLLGQLSDRRLHLLLVLFSTLLRILGIDLFVCQGLLELLQVADLAANLLGALAFLVLVALLGLLDDAGVQFSVLNGFRHALLLAVAAIVDVVFRRRRVLRAIRVRV